MDCRVKARQWRAYKLRQQLSVQSLGCVSMTLLRKSVKRSQNLVDGEPHRKLFARAGGERQNSVEPDQCRLGGLAPHHGAEIIVPGIDRLAAGEPVDH